MTRCLEMHERLNDYADGLLAGCARREVERHLERCQACRESLEAIRSLLDAARGLPGSLEPRRDLWPGIEKALDGGRAVAGWRSGWILGHTRSHWRTGLAAAAVLLVAVIAILLVHPGWLPVGPADRTFGPPGAAALASFRSAETDYLRATDELLEELEARRDELSPEALAVVEENLRIINQAIQEVWMVLEKDPNNPRNTHVFNSVYRKKITLLQQAVRLPPQS